MKITRKFMIYVVCTGSLLLTMSLVFLYSSFVHIGEMEKFIQQNINVDDYSLAQAVGEIMKDKDKFHELLAPLFFLIATIGLLVIIIQLFYISKHIVAPITTAAEFSYKLAKGKFPPRLNFNNRQCDEIISLVKSLNFMRDRLQNSINKLKLSHKRERTIREEVEKANRIQSDFLANISPDLRNPLNSIKGWTQLILQDIENGSEELGLKKRLKMINESINMLDVQITGLLDVSEFQAEYDLNNLASFNPMEFMNELVDYNLSRFKDRELEMENHFASAIPDKIMTDRDLLFSVLDVILCAIMDASSGTFRTSYGCDMDDGTFSFWFRPENESSEIDSLVKKFEQYATFPIHKLPTLRGASMLNLLVASSRAKKLHGKFTINSQDNKHTFRVSFNLTDIETDEIIGRTPLSHKASNFSQQSREYDYIDSASLEQVSTTCRLNVLVADHDRNNTTIISEFLKDAGLQVIFADSTDKCRRIMAEDDYDVAVLGRRMAEQLIMASSEDLLPNKPIVVTASYLNEIQRRKLVLAGVNYCFIKPLDFYKLIQTIMALGVITRDTGSKT